MHVISNMGRKKLDKIRISIKLDSELNMLLNDKNLEKSGLINSLLWKYFAMENNYKERQDWDLNPEFQTEQDFQSCAIPDYAILT